MNVYHTHCDGPASKKNKLLELIQPGSPRAVQNTEALDPARRKNRFGVTKGLVTGVQAATG